MSLLHLVQFKLFHTIGFLFLPLGSYFTANRAASPLDLLRKSFCFKWRAWFLATARQHLFFSVLFVSWSVLSGKEQKELYGNTTKRSPAGLSLPRCPTIWECLERTKHHKQWEDDRKAALPNHPLLQSSMREQNKPKLNPTKQEM